MPAQRRAYGRGTSQLRPSGGRTADVRRRARGYAYSSDTTSSDTTPIDALPLRRRRTLCRYPPLRTFRGLHARADDMSASDAPSFGHVLHRYAIAVFKTRRLFAALRRIAFFTKRNSNIFVIKFQHFLSISIYNSFQIYLERSDS